MFPKALEPINYSLTPILKWIQDIWYNKGLGVSMNTMHLVGHTTRWYIIALHSDWSATVWSRITMQGSQGHTPLCPYMPLQHSCIFSHTVTFMFPVSFINLMHYCVVNREFLKWIWAHILNIFCIVQESTVHQFATFWYPAVKWLWLAYPHQQLIQCCRQMTQGVQFYHSSSMEVSSHLKVLFSHVNGFLLKDAMFYAIHWH